MKINQLQLPEQLESDLEAGRTSLGPGETRLLRALLTRVEGPLPAMYRREGILSVNRLGESQDVENYLGTASETYRPGDIDPRSALIIGQAEPDSPIALDYRTVP